MKYKKKPDDCNYQIQFRWDNKTEHYVVDKIFWQVIKNGEKGRRHYLTSMPLDEKKGTILRLGDIMTEEFQQAYYEYFGCV